MKSEIIPAAVELEGIRILLLTGNRQEREVKRLNKLMMMIFIDNFNYKRSNTENIF